MDRSRFEQGRRAAGKAMGRAWKIANLLTSAQRAKWAKGFPYYISNDT